MGKFSKENKTAETAGTEGAPAEGGAARGKKVMLKDPSSGQEIARVDVIKALFKDGAGLSRGAIVKELKEKYQHEVPYQIVFASTKHVKVSANKAANAEAPAAPATEAAAG